MTGNVWTKYEWAKRLKDNFKFARQNSDVARIFGILNRYPWFPIDLKGSFRLRHNRKKGLIQNHLHYTFLTRDEKDWWSDYDENPALKERS